MVPRFTLGILVVRYSFDRMIEGKRLAGPLNSPTGSASAKMVNAHGASHHLAVLRDSDSFFYAFFERHGYNMSR